jgi:hypothetical protein
MKIFSSVVLFTFILVTSCKKDRLEEEYEQLTGKWRLDYIVERTFNTLSSTSIYDTIFSSEIQNTYELDFIKKGKLLQIKDGETVRKDRIVFSSFDESDCYSTPLVSYLFVIHLNNDQDDRFVGCLINDTLSASREHVSEEYIDYTDNNLQINYYFIYHRE